MAPTKKRSPKKAAKRKRSVEPIEALAEDEVYDEGGEVTKHKAHVSVPYPMPIQPRHLMAAMRVALKNYSDLSGVLSSNECRNLRAEIAGAAMMERDDGRNNPVLEAQFLKLLSVGFKAGLNYAGIGWGWFHKPSGKILEPLNAVAPQSEEDLKQERMDREFKDMHTNYGMWLRGETRGDPTKVRVDQPSCTIIAREIHRYLKKKKFDFDKPLDYKEIGNALDGFKYQADWRGDVIVREEFGRRIAMGL